MDISPLQLPLAVVADAALTGLIITRALGWAVTTLAVLITLAVIFGRD